MNSTFKHEQIWQAWLDLHLEQECIFSQHAGTGSQARSLHYVPGANLLGMLAARCYAQLPPAHARWLFHSGEVRFGDARLVCAEQVAQPLPRSLVHNKEGVQDRYWHAWQRESADFPQQARRPAPCEILPHNGQSCTVNSLLRIKTALDRSSGASLEGNLFAYESLPPGLHLRASLKARVRQPWQEELLRTILATLGDAQQGSLVHLGKSRSAQYGAARLQLHSDWQILDEADWPLLPGQNAVGMQAGQEISLYLLSDLALLPDLAEKDSDSAAHTPALALLPTSASLGLPGAQAVADKCFLHTRRYSPYNSHFQSQDSERLVLVRGSVLHYRLNADLDAAQVQALRRRLCFGLGAGGLYAANGLGEVSSSLPDPNAWVQAAKQAQQAQQIQQAQQTAPARRASPAASVAPAGEEDELIAWLHHAERNRGMEQRQAREQRLEADLQQLLAFYAECRRFQGLSPGQKCGPGVSQWGQVRAIARQAMLTRAQARCLQDLEDDELWKMSNPQGTSLIKLLQAILSRENEGRYLERLAHGMQKELQKMPQKNTAQAAPSGAHARRG